MREVLIRGDAVPDPIPDPPARQAEIASARSVEARVIEALSRLQQMDSAVQLRAMEFLGAFGHYAKLAVASCDRKDIALDLVQRERRRLLRCLLELEQQARRGEIAGHCQACDDRGCAACGKGGGSS